MRVLPAAALLWLLLGCCVVFTSAPAFAKKKKQADAVLPADAAWARAQDLFARGKWFRAQELLKAIVLNYSGSAFIDSAQFLAARCSFELGDELVAADEFHKVINQYPFSKVAGDAAFWEARSNYELAPGYALDQESTERSLEAFQRYLEEYPGHTLADSAYKYIGYCREKLAHKSFAAADLYRTLQEYASAVLYAEMVLSNYYDTSWAEPALFLKGESLLKLNDFAKARDALSEFVSRYPRGVKLERAKSLLAEASKQAAAGSSADNSK